MRVNFGSYKEQNKSGDEEMEDTAVEARKKQPEAGKPRIFSGPSSPVLKPEEKPASADAFTEDFPAAASSAGPAAPTTLDAPDKPAPEAEKATTDKPSDAATSAEPKADAEAAKSAKSAKSAVEDAPETKEKP